MSGEYRPNYVKVSLIPGGLGEPTMTFDELFDLPEFEEAVRRALGEDNTPADPVVEAEQLLRAHITADQWETLKPTWQTIVEAYYEATKKEVEQ